MPADAIASAARPAAVAASGDTTARVSAAALPSSAPAPLRVVIAAEGSGGHVIPALEVAQALAQSGASVTLLCAQRPHTAGLFDELFRAARSRGVAIASVSLARAPRVPGPFTKPVEALWRVVHVAAVWRAARAHLHPKPDVVVGFGGAFSMPVLAAAWVAGASTMLHEQNVEVGRANRWALRLVDEAALSFEATGRWTGAAEIVVTGLPVRAAIGAVGRDEAASRFGFDPSSPTVLVLGGSQGAAAINRLVGAALAQLTDDERRQWQWLHLTGPRDCAAWQRAYREADARAWVAAHLDDMPAAYAVADLAIARAGASTLSELAHCGLPAILIPYPYARGHQRANAALAESAGAAICLEESSTTPSQLLDAARRLLGDVPRRRVMSARFRTLARPDATAQLAGAIRRLATRTHRQVTPHA